MPELVDWSLAERIAVRAAGREPLADSYHWASLERDFLELTAQAEELVAIETGLRSTAGAAVGVVTDRHGWIAANIASFRRLLAPVTDRLGPRVGGPTVPVMRATAAFEIGLMLGWMSGRVLGQYDLLLAGDGDTDGDRTHGDRVFYVGPNVLALEKKHGFPPREFRLWLALHEVTHRAQFTGVPWMREHYLGLVDELLGGGGLDLVDLVRTLRRLAEDLIAGRNPLADGGITQVLANPTQRAALDRIGGLMSLLEGHGDVTMDRAGEGHVPSAARFARVLRTRRESATGAARFIQQFVGLEAKLNQYRQGEDFIAEVERVGGGRRAIDAAWRGPSWLPTLEEIRAPQEWVDRVRLSEELVP